MGKRLNVALFFGRFPSPPSGRLLFGAGGLEFFEAAMGTLVHPLVFKCKVGHATVGTGFKGQTPFTDERRAVDENRQVGDVLP